MTDDLHFVRVIRETIENVSQELMQINLGQARIQLRDVALRGISHIKSYGTYQGIQRLIRSLTSFQTVVHFMCPGTHLDRTNELAFDDSLLIQGRQDRREMVPNEMWFRARCRVQSGKSETTDVLYKGGKQPSLFSDLNTYQIRISN